MEHSIITISRQYGSGGRVIGAKLAERLNIPFYDKELIMLAAQRNPIHGSFFEHAEESGSHAFAHPINPGVPFDLPLNDKVYLAQSAIIREVAEKGPCVIVGRCADYVLSDNEHLLKVFVFANLAAREARITTEYGDTQGKIKQKILETDKKRAAYYRNYTQTEWGKTENYHICIDSGALGIDATVSAIEAAYLCRAKAHF